MFAIPFPLPLGLMSIAAPLYNNKNTAGYINSGFQFITVP